jgi:alpha-beta hydrolase superfamily lysophospholipase
VLCSPIGWEALAIQRAYRSLAESLSGAGFAALRFDLDGTGDSAGDDTDPDRVEHWVRSIEDAASHLRQCAGVSEVSLVGIHLGATLAAEAAARLGGVSSLVLWAPISRGSQFVRQVKALQALSTSETSGFVFTEPTLSSLSELNLAIRPLAAPRVLLLEKDDRSGEDPWSEAGAGAEVNVKVGTGYSEMMQEPRKSVLPVKTLDDIVSWLDDVHGASQSRHAGSIPPSPQTVRGDGFEEEALFFGEGARAFGILSRPDTPRPHRPAIIFLNTASRHRVGPNRMYVRFARALAARGFHAFRFDPSGVGDHSSSIEPRKAHAYTEGRLLDSQAALAALAERGIAQRFVLIGLCSGAYVASNLADRDPRVVSEILINPETFVWREGDPLEGTQALPSDSDRVHRAFQRRLERGNDVQIVFGENEPGLGTLEEYVGPNGGTLGRFPHFQLRILEGADHTFSGRVHQQRLMDLILEHLESRFS